MRKLILALCLLTCHAAVAADPALAFPGAVGWAANTVGGRGGRIIRVTNLNAKVLGRSSLRSSAKARAS